MTSRGQDRTKFADWAFLAFLHVCDTIEGLRLVYYALLLDTETS
jgi:hypothetical protein